MPNFKGFMVGNAVTNWKYDATPAFIEMALAHQLIDPIVYRDIMTVCPEDGIDVHEDLNLMCIKFINTFYQITMEINIYDIYGKCYAPSESMKLGLHFSANQQESCGLEERPKLGKGRKSYTSRQLTPFLYNSRLMNAMLESSEHP